MNLLRDTLPFAYVGSPIQQAFIKFISRTDNNALDGALESLVPWIQTSYIVRSVATRRFSKRNLYKFRLPYQQTYEAFHDLLQDQ